MQVFELILKLCLIWLTTMAAFGNSKLTNETTSGKIVVVGGGIAGLSVCYYLQQNGIKDYVLIEASDRIGGRIQTIPFENSYVELGAQYIHGESGPTYDLAKQLGLIDTTKYKADTWLYGSQDGQKLGETVVEPIWEGISDWIDSKVPGLIEGRYKNSPSVSMGRVFDDYYQETLLPKYKSKMNESVLKAIYKGSIDSERIDSAVDNLNDLGAQGWNAYENLDGEDVILKYGNNLKGYTTLLDFLVSKIPAANIYTNQKIEQIDLTNVGKANGIKMTVYSQTDKTRQTVQSTYVVSTVSLGVLKKDMNTLFKPVALPAAKQDAINKMGFGCVDKLFVVFDKPFSDDRFEGLGIMWRDDVQLNLQAAQKWKLNNNKFYKAFNTFERLPQYNNVLMGFLVGEDAEYIESLDDQCVLDYVTEVLQKVFPNRGLPTPKKILKTRWRNNEYARGSYSYIKTDTTSDLTNTLTQPIGSKFYFAGEATLAKYIGTAHGAFISGQNVAKKIIKDMASKN